MVQAIIFTFHYEIGKISQGDITYIQHILVEIVLCRSRLQAAVDPFPVAVLPPVQSLAKLRTCCPVGVGTLRYDPQTLGLAVRDS